MGAVRDGEDGETGGGLDGRVSGSREGEIQERGG